MLELWDSLAPIAKTSPTVSPPYGSDGSGVAGFNGREFEAKISSVVNPPECLGVAGFDWEELEDSIVFEGEFWRYKGCYTKGCSSKG